MRAFASRKFAAAKKLSCEGAAEASAVTDDVACGTGVISTAVGWPDVMPASGTEASKADSVS